MSKLVFLLAVLLLSNSACRVNGCIEDFDCILDEECCTGFCDWDLGYYPYSGECAPRPSSTPPKPCIPLGTGQTCVYNVTCCQGYCERRYSTEGFCVIGAPPGFGLPPSEPPAPIAPEIAPVPSPIAPTISPSSVIVPPLPVSAPTPSLSKKGGSKKEPAAPTKAPSKKDKIKHKPVAPTPAPSKKDGRKIK